MAINKRLHDKAKKMCYNSIIKKEREVQNDTLEPFFLGFLRLESERVGTGERVFEYFGRCAHGGACARGYN